MQAFGLLQARALPAMSTPVIYDKCWLQNVLLPRRSQKSVAKSKLTNEPKFAAIEATVVK